MAARVSKVTSDQLRYSRSVEAATAQHGESLAQKVTKLLWGEEAPPVSLVVIVRAMLVLLQVASRALRTADEKYVNEAADDDPARVERDAAASEVSGVLGTIQHSIVGAFGEVYAGKVGLLSPFERRADMLARRARRVVDSLRKVAPPESLLDGISVDVAILADRLEAATDRLQSALDVVASEKVELDAVYVAREQAAERWERVMRLVANFMVGLAEVAGEFGIAARIRPTVRRLRGELTGDDVEGDIVVEDGGEGEDDPDPNDPLVAGPTEPESGT